MNSGCNTMSSSLYMYVILCKGFHYSEFGDTIVQYVALSSFMSSKHLFEYAFVSVKALVHFQEHNY